jgi:hypothetical protein
MSFLTNVPLNTRIEKFSAAYNKEHNICGLAVHYKDGSVEFCPIEDLQYAQLALAMSEAMQTLVDELDEQNRSLVNNKDMN